MGLYGFAMSRFSGCYAVAFKLISETVDSSASIYVSDDSPKIVLPEDFVLPASGVNLRWPDAPMEQELRLQHDKIYAALAYARVNKLNRITVDSPNPRLGIIASGKSYLRRAVSARRPGHRRARGREDRHSPVQGRHVVAARAHRRARVRERPFRDPGGRGKAGADRVPAEAADLQLAGRRAPAGDRKAATSTASGEVHRSEWLLLPPRASPHPGDDRARRSRKASASSTRQQDDRRAPEIPGGEGGGGSRAAALLAVARIPYFCSGCSHNTSTRVPEGSKALVGTGRLPLHGDPDSSRRDHDLHADGRGRGAMRSASRSSPTPSQRVRELRATAPIYIAASSRSARRPRPTSTSPTRSCSTTRWP